MSREKYGLYEFEIKCQWVDELSDKFVYTIYTEGCKPYDDGIIESNEWFETEQEARFAAIGHITLLENGPE